MAKDSGPVKGWPSAEPPAVVAPVKGGGVLDRWRMWAGVLVFFAFVMGSASSGADAGQRGEVAAMATGALVLLLVAVGVREVWRRWRTG